MTVGVLSAIVALLGMLSVGLFIVPLAAILLVLALPIPPENSAPRYPTALPPPGWYENPGGRHGWRFWDGSSWTG
ncbi:MAG: hypothetical protein ACRDWE_09815 [Acidimicrobiales bacterium]